MSALCILIRSYHSKKYLKYYKNVYLNNNEDVNVHKYMIKINKPPGLPLLSWSLPHHHHRNPVPLHRHPRHPGTLLRLALF